MNRRNAALGVIVLLFGASALALPALPERVPIHWNLAGEPDGWASAGVGALLLPGVALATWALLVGLGRLPSGGRDSKAVRRFLDRTTLAITALWAVLHLTVLAELLGRSVYPDITAIGLLAVGAFLAWTGVEMRRRARTPDGPDLVNLPTDDREAKREVLRGGGAALLWAGATMGAGAAFGPTGRLALLLAGVVPVGLLFPLWALWTAARSG